MNSAMALTTVHTRARSRIHVGSTMELQYKLRSYGIPMDTYPIDIDGNLRKDILYAFIDEYLAKQHAASMQTTVEDNDALQLTPPAFPETLPDQSRQGIGDTPPAQTLADVPNENDVLLGRGKYAQSWPGNVQFREFLRNHSAEYDQVPRQDKQRASVALTQKLEENGVRFFRQTNRISGEWIQVDYDEARKTVSQYFRSRKRKKPSAGSWG